MKRWAVLLRAVNVGGNRLAMADLRALLADLGFADPKTLLASGNAVFGAPQDDAAAVEALLEREASARLGFATEFLVRDAGDLDAVIAANPFPAEAADHPGHLMVVFHRDPVPAAPVEAVRAAYAGPERMAAVGRELFIDYPEGIGRSMLTPAMAKARFPKLATARNWNTVLKLRALLD